jgi:hypothetical protein
MFIGPFARGFATRKILVWAGGGDRHRAPVGVDEAP